MGSMATPINAPMAGEIWHLSIEDLFQPVQEAPRLGGEGPFVINLSVSTAPIGLPAKPFAGCRGGHIYQIQVTEDGRTRFRLRLGPFITEDEADAVLAEVREIYPGALTATAGDSDLRVIGSMQAKIEARQAGAQKATEKPATIQRAFQQKAVPQEAVPQKTAPAAAPAPVPPAVSADADAEISIDIAWPTPELVIPAAPPPRDLAPQWSLPELDIPLPAVAAGKAKAAPFLLTEMVIPVVRHPAPKAVAPAPIAPTPVAVAAPVLTEAVTAKSKTAPMPPQPAVTPPPATVPKLAIAPPPVIVPTLAAAPAPVIELTLEVVPSPATVPTLAVAPPPAIVPTLAVAPPPAIAPKLAVTPPPAIAPTVVAPPSLPKRTAPPADKPGKHATPPLKQAAPQVRQAQAPVKPAPVLTQSVASPPKPSAPKSRQSTFNISGNKLTSLQHVVVATAPAPAAREVKKLDKPLESLESTQTIRALTPTEMEDIEASRWFVIQLALADHAFDPDAVPNLDLFDEYRLYSVAGLDQGRLVHSLRLGFFREEIGAVAVASYLAAYWEKPTIKRVSLAERERFADQRVEARKDVGATGKHAVIEITDELVARRRRTSKIAVTVKSSNQPVGH